ncbi:MAG: hypothetical protein ACP5O1_05035 [Phycisphaerae bacterium]
MNRHDATEPTDGTDEPLGGGRVLELYFLKARAASLDIAAMLDRLARAEQTLGPVNDERKTRLKSALDVLADDGGDKARRIQEIFSIKG